MKGNTQIAEDTANHYCVPSVDAVIKKDAETVSRARADMFFMKTDWFFTRIVSFTGY